MMRYTFSIRFAKKKVYVLQNAYRSFKYEYL